MQPNSDTPAVEVRDLIKAYGGRTVVDGLSFSVEQGEVFALLGPNGAGKTTTVEILEGYRHADAGYVRVLGLDPRRQSSDLKPNIGLMLQQGGLFPQITAREALRLFAAFYPEVRGRGTTVLLTTHFMDEAEQLANRVAIVDHGRLVALDTPAGLRQASANEIRFVCEPRVSEEAVALALDLPRGAVDHENDGTLVVHVEPTPARIATLTSWLADQETLLTELRAGSRSLEQAFLTLTASRDSDTA
jgi:ABC-type multidrug transport system ATPase subunit